MEVNKGSLGKIISSTVNQNRLEPDQIPELDLYIDQILMLFEDKLGETRRREKDKILTKSMVNNYSKEKLISPTKGKKYSREQIIRILMICYLKQVLSIQDIKKILSFLEGEEEIQQTYQFLLQEKQKVTGQIFLDAEESFIGKDDVKPMDAMKLIIHLSLLSSYTRRVSEALIDTLFTAEEKDPGN